MTETKLSLHLGNSLDVLPTLEENSVDSIVTDPPYGLNFMGKDWDHGIPGEHFWKEALRVAKPGAYLLAFGGTRTYHRLTCAIEDAGWEIRDCIMWVYGSGFPKSMDIGKAIEKRRASNDVIRPWLKSLGTREEIAKAASVTPRQVDHWLGENTPCPQTLTEKRYKLISKHFKSFPEWQDDIFEKQGEKIGEKTHSRSGGEDFAKIPGRESKQKTEDVRILSTDAAKKWDGWGTALKPAYEPIIVARKPIEESTIAGNVLKYGTGGINIDECRVETGHSVESINLGRWPTNLIHDGSEEVTELFPVTKSGRSNGNAKLNVPSEKGITPLRRGTLVSRDDEGSASRFFYCAKTSKKDRDEGLKELENIHPTVKPTSLMRYLIKLVTPKEGTVLDLFMGSGSTGKAALLEGDKFIGIEMEQEYFDIAKERLDSLVFETIL